MSNIKNELSNGVKWTAIAKYSSVAVSILVSMVLGRILTPDDFGIVAISTVLITFLGMFSRMGIGPAVIQNKDLSQSELNHIYTFSLYVGSFLTIVFFMSSWLVADFYQNFSLVNICQILSITLLFGSLNMVPDALMMRDRRFKKSAIRTLIITCISGLVSIIAAISGLGVYSLLITPVSISVGMFFYNIRFYPLSFCPCLSIEPIKKIATFSIYQFLFELSNYFFRNFDKLLIGRLFAPAYLGYYEKSYRLMQMPTQNISGVISPVLQPVLSELQDDLCKMADKFNHIVRIVAMISFPLAGILYFNAYEIIIVMFGGQWELAVPVFKIMSLSIPLQLITSSSGAVFQAANDTKQLFFSGVLSSFVTIVAFLFGSLYFKSIEAVAWGWTISSVISFILSFYILYHNVFKTPIRHMYFSLIHPCVGLLMMSLFYFIYSLVMFDGNLIINLFIKVILGITIYLLYLDITGVFKVWQFCKNKVSRKYK